MIEPSESKVKSFGDVLQLRYILVVVNVSPSHIYLLDAPFGSDKRRVVSSASVTADTLNEARQMTLVNSNVVVNH
jgi:hypothetical protein